MLSPRDVMDTGCFLAQSSIHRMCRVSGVAQCWPECGQVLVRVPRKLLRKTLLFILFFQLFVPEGGREQNTMMGKEV